MIMISCMIIEDFQTIRSIHSRFTIRNSDSENPETELIKIMHACMTAGRRTAAADCRSDDDKNALEMASNARVA